MKKSSSLANGNGNAATSSGNIQKGHSSSDQTAKNNRFGLKIGTIIYLIGEKIVGIKNSRLNF